MAHGKTTEGVGKGEGKGEAGGEAVEVEAAAGRMMDMVRNERIRIMDAPLTGMFLFVFLSSRAP